MSRLNRLLRDHNREVPYRILAKTPLWAIGGIEFLSQYISASPGLDFLLNEIGHLDIHVVDNTVIFTCNHGHSLEQYDKRFSNNIAICPTTFFLSEFVEQHRKPPVNNNTMDEWVPGDDDC